MKTCKKCRIEKESSEFHRAAKRKDGLQNWCKQCAVQSAMTRNKQNPVRTDGFAHKFRCKKYGITPDLYDLILQEQSGLCKICLQSQPNKRLAIDHCHATNRVRGLLCEKCNRGLGLFQDSVACLNAAIEYLKNASSLEDKVED